jgi:hypothetical protein
MADKVGDVPFREVSANKPCPICAKSNWCSVREDGAYAVCKREAYSATYGNGCPKTDKNGEPYWVYRLTPKTPSGEQWDQPRYSLADGGGERADPDTLHKVYSALLAHKSFRLWSKHQKDLYRRGLPVKQSQDYHPNPDKKRAHAVYALVITPATKIITSRPAEPRTQRSGVSGASGRSLRCAACAARQRAC